MSTCMRMQSHKHTQAHKCTNIYTHRHDSSGYCSHFYGSPISLLLPFVLRIISLHGMEGFQLSHFLFLLCMSPIFTFLCCFFLPPFSTHHKDVWRSFIGHASTDRWSKTPEVLFLSVIASLPFYFTFSVFSLALSLYPSLSPAPSLSLCITGLFGRQNHAASLCSICTVHLDGIVC